MKKHIEFVRWLKSHDSRLYKTRIAVYSKDFRGLHATVDIGKLQEIMSVPMSLTISAADLENTPIGKKLVEKQVFETKWAVFIFPLIYILEELDNPSSKHSVWLKTFPEDASEHPAFYSESELEWLRGSNMLNQLHYDKALIAQFYYTIASVYPDFAVRHTLRKFTMYYYLLCSRFFGINSYDPDRAFVVPYADLANTGLFAKRNAAWDYDSLRHHFRLFALAPIKAEEPVFIFEQPVHEQIIVYYGHGSNFVYLLYYGMTLEGEEYNAVGFVQRFEEKTVPHAKLKAKLIDQGLTMSKKTKFYQAFPQRIRSNFNFMSAWRYFLYDGDPAKLAKVLEED
eukprot:TRINITY_DN2197_c0_g1_i1.p2 TRINITY_DN2197_c0_g1~~TRINITY_DN2197_c0_g1_i1.p2  ORF type:complete len:340 (+),score=27.41 TRINITY_DN2197_c0_g1_i1:473-1492(+)